MENLTYNDIVAACARGGARHLTITTELEPAAGPGTPIAPPTYLNGDDPTYAFTKRFVDGELVDTVTIDSKGSSNNRAEAELVEALRSPYGGDDVLAQTPHMEVVYGESSYFDCELPHRMSDGHFRAASIDGVDLVKNETYLAARNSTAANMRPVLELSPISLVMGVWDSTRTHNQLRLTSALTGETFGVLAHGTRENVSLRGGMRNDPVAASIPLSKDDLADVAATQNGDGEINAKYLEAKSYNGKETKASSLGLGAVPPGLKALGLISCRSITRTTTLSFGVLRSMRFGMASAEADQACRALLAALALDLVARANEEVAYRANCELVETDQSDVALHFPAGVKHLFNTPTREVADAILGQAIEAARKHGIAWGGQCLSVVGNPKIVAVEGSEESSDV